MNKEDSNTRYNVCVTLSLIIAANSKRPASEVREIIADRLKQTDTIEILGIEQPIEDFEITGIFDAWWNEVA